MPAPESPPPSQDGKPIFDGEPRRQSNLPAIIPGENGEGMADGDKRPVELWFALSLAGLAGWVDAIAFVHWSGIYVSFMSGNSTTFGVSLFEGAWSTAVPIGAVLLGFVIGVMVGEWVAQTGRRFGHALVLFTEALFLFAAAGVTALDRGLWLPAVLLTMGLGVQNATIYQVGGVSLAVSYVTGTMVHIGRGLANAISRAGPWRAPLPYAALWTCLISGAAAGAATARYSAIAAITVAATVALTFAIGTAHAAHRDGQAAL